MKADVERIKKLEAEIAERKQKIELLQNEIKELETEKMNFEDPLIIDLFDFAKKYKRVFNHAGITRLSELYRFLEGDFSGLQNIKDRCEHMTKRDNLKYSTPEARLQLLDYIGPKISRMIMNELNGFEETKK